MKTLQLEGVLEVDHARGVVYFHLKDPELIARFGTQTVLRICNLPKPIPKDCQIDLTHMVGVNWHNEEDE